jgi:hypothetical protein
MTEFWLGLFLCPLIFSELIFEDFQVNIKECSPVMAILYALQQKCKVHKRKEITKKANLFPEPPCPISF